MTRSASAHMVRAGCLLAPHVPTQQRDHVSAPVLYIISHAIAGKTCAFLLSLPAGSPLWPPSGVAARHTKAEGDRRPRAQKNDGAIVMTAPPLGTLS